MLAIRVCPSRDKARAAAWSFAQKLAPLDAKPQQDEILAADPAIATIGKIIKFPGITGSVILTLVRIGERGGVPKIIRILN